MNDGAATLTAGFALFGKTMNEFIYDVLAFGNVKADANTTSWKVWSICHRDAKRCACQ
jgi:hypothetical protein